MMSGLNMLPLKMKQFILSAKQYKPRKWQNRDEMKTTQAMHALLQAFMFALRLIYNFIVRLINCNFSCSNGTYTQTLD